MNLEKYSDTLQKCSKKGAVLVAVSKTRSQDEIKEMYHTGQRIFGENRVQELVEKAAKLPQDIAWHQIGHLQTNKVKYIAPFVDLIHAVDSFKLLKEINKEAKKNNRIIDCLLQFHIADEESKYGLNIATTQEILSSKEFQDLKNIQICGVMGMATFTENAEQIQQEFSHLKSIFSTLKQDFFEKKHTFKHLSMGMSGDFEIALQEGSTMVRIGSLLFN